MDQSESVGVLEQKYSRRTFIKGVIATGATVSSTGYLFRGTSLLGAATYQTATERHIASALPVHRFRFCVRAQAGFKCFRGCNSVSVKFRIPPRKPNQIAILGRSLVSQR